MKELMFTVFNKESVTPVISIPIKDSTKNTLTSCFEAFNTYTDEQVKSAVFGLCDNPMGPMANEGKLIEFTSGDLYIRAIVIEHDDLSKHHHALVTRE